MGLTNLLRNKKTPLILNPFISLLQSYFSWGNEATKPFCHSAPDRFSGQARQSLFSKRDCYGFSSESLAMTVNLNVIAGMAKGFGKKRKARRRNL